MKYYYVFIALFSFLSSISMQINASDWDEWVYVNLAIGAVVNPENPHNNMGWDIACHRYHFRTNSGLAGVGNGGAYIDSVNTWTSSIYNNLIEVPFDGVFLTDTLVNTFYDINEHEGGIEGVANPNLEKWAVMDTDNNYTMYFTNNQYIVRDGLGENYYKLWAVDYYNQNGTSGYITIIYDEIQSNNLSVNNILPFGVNVFSNYPNPFNPITTIPISVDIAGEVKAELFDIYGRKLYDIEHSFFIPGYYELVLDVDKIDVNLTSGIYFSRIIFENQIISNKKINLIK